MKLLGRPLVSTVLSTALLATPLAVVLAATTAVLAPSPASAQQTVWTNPGAGHGDFNYLKCKVADYVVPAGVHLVTMTVQGGNGIGGYDSFSPTRSGGAGGAGGKVRAQVEVTPGQTFYLSPDSVNFIPGPGGDPNANGVFGGSGGPASAISTQNPCQANGSSLFDLLPSGYVMVAGGGGGGGSAITDTAPSGGPPGVQGGNFPGGKPFGGQPGTTTAGGAGGEDDGTSGTFDGQSGSLYIGGKGGHYNKDGYPFATGGGGGGAGMYGGGGGGGGKTAGAGGGGGGNYLSPSIPTGAPASALVPGTIMSGAGDGAAGYVSIEPVYEPTVAVTASPNPSQVAAAVTFTATVTGYPTGSAVGTVAFQNQGGGPYGSASVNSNGVATLTVNSFFNTAGTYTVKAVYSGGQDTDGLVGRVRGATSPVINQVVTNLPAPATVTGTTAYGTGVASFSYTMPSLPSTTVNGTVSCTTADGGTPLAALTVGSHALDPSSCSGLSLSGAGASSYTLGYAGAISVTKATLTSKVDGYQTFGGTPLLRHFETGLPSGVSVTGTPVCPTIANGTSIGASLPVGNYPLGTCAGLSLAGVNAGSYQLSVAPQDFTVYAAKVYALVAATRIYGQPATFSYTASQDVAFSTIALPAGMSVTGNASCTQDLNGHSLLTHSPSSPESVGVSYKVNAGSCSGLSLSGPGSSAYSIEYVGDKVTVNPAPVDVVLAGTSTFHGSPAYAVSFDNLPAGFTTSGTPTCTTVDGGTPVATATSGNHTIDGSSCSGLVLNGFPSNPGTNWYARYSGTLTVSAAPLTVIGPNVFKQYGAQPGPLMPTYEGFVDGDTVASLVTPATCVSNASPSSHVGQPIPVNCLGASSPKYSISYVPGSVTITKAPLTITATSAPYTYGETRSPVTPTYAGFIGGEDARELTSEPTCSSSLSAQAPAGTHHAAAKCEGASADNYAISYVDGDVVVNKRELTVTASDGTSVYGAAPATITPSYAGFAPGESPASLTTLPTCSAHTLVTTGAGTHVSKCTGAADGNYSFQYVEGVVTVTKAPLAVTAPSPTKGYGTAIPALLPSITGYRNGDGVGNLTAPPTCSTTATADSPVGAYAVSCTGGTDDSYSFGYTAGSLSVTKAPLTITAGNAQSVYGDPAPAIAPWYSGFVNGDDPDDLTTKPTCSAASITPQAPAGTHHDVGKCVGAVTPNYTITYVNGDVLVAKRDLTVTASNGTNVYGSAAPTITPGYTGFASGDNAGTSIGTAPTCVSGTDQSTVPGTYASTSSCSGAASANYALSYAKGTVTVTRAPLTVNAISPTKVYGAANPALPPSMSGFVNGESATSLSTAPTCVTTAQTSSGVGSYAVNCSGGVSNKYTFAYNAGSLSITKAPLTITAGNASTTYGDPAPVVAPSYTGFVVGDDADDLTSKPSCTSNTTPATGAGTYPGITTCAGAASGNYAITYAKGNVTVAKAPVNVIASAGTQVYGATVKPTITPSYSGLKNNQSPSVLGNGIQCVSNVNNTTAAGTYPNKSICSGAVPANYSISYVAGTVTVTKAPVVITAGPTTSVWGTPSPVPAAAFAGFKNGQTKTELTTQPTCVTTVTPTTNAGSYTGANTCTGAVAANYSFSYLKGNAVVTKASLVITVPKLSIRVSVLAGRTTFTGKVTHAGTGAGVAGVPVTFAATPGLGPTVTCVGTSNSAGAVTCSTVKSGLLLTIPPKTYTGKTPAATNYTATTGTGPVAF
jgi:hypothetical protein